MKKSFIAAALSLTAVGAMAGVTGFSTVEADRANAGQALGTQYELATGVRLGTKLGTVDGAVVARRINPGQDDALGLEVGLSRAVKVGPVNLQARVAYGRINQVNTYGGNSEYASVGAETSVPLIKGLNTFVGYRHRAGLTTDTPSSNRFTVGVDLPVLKNVGARVAYAHTRMEGTAFNGITAGLTYKF